MGVLGHKLVEMRPNKFKVKIAPSICGVSLEIWDIERPPLDTQKLTSIPVTFEYQFYNKDNNAIDADMLTPDVLLFIMHQVSQLACEYLNDK